MHNGTLKTRKKLVCIDENILFGTGEGYMWGSVCKQSGVWYAYKHEDGSLNILSVMYFGKVCAVLCP